MGGLGMVLRSELRRRWRALVGLALLGGIPIGVAIAAATGAVRTDSATDRLIAATKAPQIYMVPAFQETKLAFEDIAKLPVVSEALLFHGLGTLTEPYKDDDIGAPSGVDIFTGRTHLLSGRTPDPRRVDEILINYKAADRYGLKVGDVLRLQMIGAGTDIFGDAPPKPGPTVTVRIVGVQASPGDFVGIAQAGFTFTPAFDAHYASQLTSVDLYVFSLKRGVADIGEFDKQIRSLTGGKPVLYVDTRSGMTQIHRSFHIVATAFWVLGGFVALAGVLIFGQAFGRQTSLLAPEQTTFRSLGMTRSDLIALALVRAALVVAGAEVIAAIAGSLLTPLTPVGAPRLAEPNPGISVPLSTFGGGLALAFGVLFVLAAIPSWLAVRAVGREAPAAVVRPSAIARFVAAVTRRSGPSVGARFALERGRGTSAVPVRSSLAATVSGIVALIAALIVAASLHQLLVTPRLYGWNWDLVLTGGEHTEFARGSEDLEALIKDPAIAELSVGVAGEGTAFRVGDIPIEGIAADPIKGNIGPTLLAGRVPVAADEVALGPKTMQAAHARIGSTVELGQTGNPESFRARVVGEVLLPFDDDTTSVGEGMWLTKAGAERFFPAIPSDFAVIRFAPGVDRAATIDRLLKRYPSDGGPDGKPTSTIKDYGRTANLSAALSGLLALLAAGTLAHMLTTSIKRRRRDVAILKTLGFGRGQVRSAVEWQAFIFTFIAVAISIPVGIILGRWVWRVIARYAGFAPSPAVPALRLLLVAGAALATALLLALLPARSAARTPPALVLRTE
jgi:putative ABC transport system permease protein